MRLVLLLCVVAFPGCKTHNKVAQAREEPPQAVAAPPSADSAAAPAFVPQYTPGPPALVYKTRADYFNLVPVLLSEDRTEIIVYPHPADVRTSDGYPLPAQLHGGYLLDNRGIAEQVAFLNMTYEAYAGLREAPSPEQLYDLIIDKDPLTELCDCGNRKFLSEVQLNKLIDDGRLRTACRTLK